MINLRFVVVLMRNNKKWAKSDLKLAETHEQKGCHMKTIEQLKIFSAKDVSYNFTKSYQVSAASANYSRSSR